jgi:hypothetical protein
MILYTKYIPFLASKFDLLCISYLKFYQNLPKGLEGVAKTKRKRQTDGWTDGQIDGSGMA